MSNVISHNFGFKASSVDLSESSAVSAEEPLAAMPEDLPEFTQEEETPIQPPPFQLFKRPLIGYYAEIVHIEQTDSFHVAIVRGMSGPDMVIDYTYIQKIMKTKTVPQAGDYVVFGLTTEHGMVPMKIHRVAAISTEQI